MGRYPARSAACKAGRQPLVCLSCAGERANYLGRHHSRSSRFRIHLVRSVSLLHNVSRSCARFCGQNGRRRDGGAWRASFAEPRAPGFTPHVGHGVQRNLPAKRRRLVASHFGHKSVRCFVTRCGKEKRYVPDESENEKIGSDIRQGSWPFRLRSSSRLEVVAQLCKPRFARDTAPSSRRTFPGGLHERKCARFSRSVVNSTHGEHKKEEKQEAEQVQKSPRQETAAHKEPFPENGPGEKGRSSKEEGAQETRSAWQERERGHGGIRAQGSGGELRGPVRRFAGLVKPRGRGFRKRG